MKKIIVIVSLVIFASFQTNEAKAQLGFNEGYNDGFVACTNSLLNIIQENPLWSTIVTTTYYVRNGTAAIWNTTDSYTYFDTPIEDRFLGFVTSESGVVAAQLAVNSMLGSGTYAQIEGYQNSSNDYNRGVYEGYLAAMVAIVVQF